MSPLFLHAIAFFRIENLMLSLCVPALLTLALVAAEPGPREIKGTQLIVQAELDGLEAPEGNVEYQPSEALAAAFPGYMFVLASFPEVDPSELPEPLTPRNLYAIDPDGESRLLATPEDVLALFEEAFDPVKTVEDAKKAAQAALALEAAKYPEQPFTTPADGLQAMPDGSGGFTASGASQPAPGGGTGPISVNLSFGSGGAPAKYVVKNDYRPRARRTRAVTPADIAADQPLVQKIFKGPVTNINSPTINKTLPGNTFFSSPGKKSSGKGKKKDDGKRGVAAVDRDGKVNELDDNRALGTYVRRQFGKVTTPQQAREIMETYLTLATGNFPDFEFAPVKNQDIVVTTAEGGGQSVTGKVYVKGNEKKFFMARWNFYPKGGLRSGTHGNKGLHKD